MPSQTESGKAFEYALLNEAREVLSTKSHVRVIEDAPFNTAKKCFEQYNESRKSKYTDASRSAINHIARLEPRLNNSVFNSDVLTLQIVSDSSGIAGDVRDVLFIRNSQEWEIGISAKNNHKAVKHSRLSDKIDFGKEWLSINCSQNYFAEIIPIFKELRELRNNGELWRNLRRKEERFYIPVLKAFMEELLRLDKESPKKVPFRLLNYLIGSKDFYKVIKRRGKTEIYGFNLNGTLNRAFGRLRPEIKVERLKTPSRIVEIVFKQNSTNTLILSCDEGWQISFRIHNASSAVEPSLKFDINLIGQPQSLYSHHETWK